MISEETVLVHHGVHRCGKVLLEFWQHLLIVCKSRCVTRMQEMGNGKIRLLFFWNKTLSKSFRAVQGLRCGMNILPFSLSWWLWSSSGILNAENSSQKTQFSAKEVTAALTQSDRVIGLRLCAKPHLPYLTNYRWNGVEMAQTNFQ